jgi:hypothetical protein
LINFCETCAKKKERPFTTNEAAVKSGRTAAARPSRYQ